MKHTLRTLLLTLASTLLTLPLVTAATRAQDAPADSSTSASRGEVELYDYVIQRGDTCARVARRAFGDARRYDIIHAYNPGMGPTPHHLVPGETLRLPRQAVARDRIPDARVTATTREVRAREPDASAWSPARRGLGLYRAWRVNTLERSRAEVTFRDTAVLEMRADTLVIIYGASARSARAHTGRAELERGTLRSRLGELRGTLSTPSATVSSGGGVAVLAVDAEGTSRLSNHEGGAASLRSNSGGQVRVRPGFGSKVVPRHRPTPPRPLPPAPQWIEGGAARFVGAAGQGGVLRGAWQPVEGARSYRVEVSRRADGRGVVAAVELPAEITRFEIRRLPAGEYHVRLATIDGDFFESRPSTPRAMRVDLARLEGVGAPSGDVDLLADESPLEDAELPGLTLLAGTLLHAPDGLRCAQGEGAPSEELALEAPFDGDVHCVTSSGEPAPGFAIHVWAPTVEVTSGGEATRLPRGEEREVELRWQAEGEMPDDVRVVASEGVEILSSERLEPGPGMRVSLRASEDAGDEAELRLVAGEDTRLAATHLRVVEAAPPEAPEPPPPAPPEAPAPGPTRVAQEALGLMPTPWLAGLVDPYRGGSGGFLSVSLLSSPSAADGVLRVAGGGELWLGDALRVGVALPADLELGDDAPTARGHADYRLWAGYELLDPSVHQAQAALEFAIWAASGVEADGIESARLMPSVDLGLRRGAWTYRTRQGAILDTTSGGTFAWTSALGVDLSLLGDDASGARGFALSLGLELDSALGSADSGLYTAVALGAGFALRRGPLSLSLGARYHATDDLDNRMGRFSANLGLRVTAGR